MDNAKVIGGGLSFPQRIPSMTMLAAQPCPFLSGGITASRTLTVLRLD